MLKSKIIAFGRGIPAKSVSNDELCKTIDSTDEWITTRTGIKNRFIASSENTSDLCASACLDIFKKTGTVPEDIGLIIVATITPDFFTPSTACIVQHKIGAKNAVCFDINAACSGFIYALSMADKFIQSCFCKNALVLGGDVMSKIIDWSDRSTCVLFGDGAAGVLLSEASTASIICEDIHSDGQLGLSLTAGAMKSDCSPEDNLKDFYLKMDGREIFDFAIRRVPGNINAVLEKSGIHMDEIKYIVPHQANFRIVEAIAKKLKIDISKFYTNMDRFSNTSAASIPIALSEMHDNNLLKQGDKIILAGFGGGLTWGSILIQI